MVKRALRRLAGVLAGYGSGWLTRALLRQGGRSALGAALGAAVSAVPKPAERVYTQVFSVTPPLTVYVRGERCRVTLRPAEAPRVTLEAHITHPGVEFVTEQDAAGVYIVLKRAPVIGAVARVDFTLHVPRGTHLALRLKTGEVLLAEIEGLLELSAAHVFTLSEAASANVNGQETSSTERG